MFESNQKCLTLTFTSKLSFCIAHFHYNSLLARKFKWSYSAMLKMRLFELFENTVSCSFDDDGGETTIYLYVLYVAFRGGKSVK